jgi:DNA polymerase lambda
MGSYRRGATNSGDVDFLITRDSSDGLNHSGVIEKLVRRLMVKGIITHEVGPILVVDWSLEAGIEARTDL